MPPLPPGDHSAVTEEELRFLVEAADDDVSVFLAPGAYIKLSEQLNCSTDIHVTIVSSAVGATLDGQKMTRLFSLTGGCSITLQGLNLVNGKADNGGVVRAMGAGNVTLISSTISDCEATGDGGVIYAESSGDVSIVDSTIADCLAGTRGGVVFMDKPLPNSCQSATRYGPTCPGHIQCEKWEPLNDHSCYDNGRGKCMVDFPVNSFPCKYYPTDTRALSLSGTTLRRCAANNGGVIFAQRGFEVSLVNSNAFDCSADDRGGVVWVYQKGNVSLSGSHFANCSAQGEGGGVLFAWSDEWDDIVVKVNESTFTNSWANTSGGAMYTHSTRLEVEASSFSGCQANRGGALFSKGNTVLTSSQIWGCDAREKGGGIFSGMTTTLKAGTLISGCTAPSGSSLFLEAGRAEYHLPAPAGHWVPQESCLVNRKPCRLDAGGWADNPAQQECLEHRAYCALTISNSSEEPSRDEKAKACNRYMGNRTQCVARIDEEWLCRDAAFVQACNWERHPSLLGKEFYHLPLRPVNDVFPKPCAAGFLGSADSSLQSGPDCAGLCPAGSYCPEAATVVPRDCWPGYYCKEGASVPLPCPAGSYSNATNLTDAGDCTYADPGSYATTGSTEQTPCAKGTFANTSGLPECATCEGGTFQNSTGATDCRACVAGSYCEPGAAAPLPCEAGTFSDRTGLDDASQCKDAEPGYFATAGSTKQTPCSKGSYTNASKKDECVPCAGGTYLDVVKGTACVLCKAGSYCPPGAAAPLPCEAGTYSERTDLDAASSCTAAEPGYFATTGSTEQTRCAPGSIAPLTNMSACDLCSTGRYSDSTTNIFACEKCKPGTYAKSEGLSQCIPCAHPLGTPSDGSITCSVCKAGYYLKDSSATPTDLEEAPSEYCDNCPDGTNCSDGARLETLPILPGYWRASPNSTRLTECRNFDGSGTAGATRCVGGTDAGVNGDGYCGSDFTGPECQLCDASDHHLVEGDECEKCLSSSVAGGRLVGLALGLCVACGFLAWAYSMQNWRQRRYTGAPLRLADRFIPWCVAIGLQAKLKIAFGFYQVVSVLSTTYSARLPDKFTSWTDRLSSVISIDWSSFFLPVGCVPFFYRLLAVALSPVGIIALLLLVGVVLRVKRWHASTERPLLGDAVRRGMLDLTPPGLILIFCFVPSVSAFIFRSWSCEAYVISHPDASLDYIQYMRQDASVECNYNDSDYNSIIELAIFLIVLWPIGSIILFTSLLTLCYKALHTNTPTDLSQATAFLHKEYEPRWYWWEALELLRKVVLTGVVVLIPEERYFVRLVVATLVCSCYTVGLAVATPFKRIEDDILAVATNLVLLLVFLGASWTTIFEAIEDQKEGWAEDVLGWPNPDAIVYPMLVLIGVALALFLVGAAAAARRVAKVPTIRIAASKQAPELTLAKGMTWHLFNSHIWSTGQDAVAVIKNELQQLLPGIKVFLDVDDLKDIGALESYIDCSQVILFFLSKGYFRSKNCLREIRSSLEKGKPIILVQEADPAKGGGTLEELRSECPLDLQTAIFDAEWPLVVWMRIEEFQLVSLKMIAEALLLQTPTYSPAKALSLTVPGEVQGQNIGFAKPIVLWASPANQGARRMANELADSFAGIVVSDAAEVPDHATHMLLYLCESTFADDALAEQVKAVREARLPIVMAHENDPERGGCVFARFFETTPQELVAGGLYRKLAVACFPGRHREVSLALLAKAFGATKQTPSCCNLRKWGLRQPQVTMVGEEESSIPFEARL